MAIQQSLSVRSNLRQIIFHRWSTCYFCRSARAQHRTPKANLGQSVSKSHLFGVRYTSSMLNTRFRLRDALLELQKHASVYINQSRLKLALRGLEQRAGDETIRIAIMCTKNRKSSYKKVKELLRLLIADPLKPEEKWEQALLADGSQSILLKVTSEMSQRIFKEDQSIRELQVSCPNLNGRNIEFFIIESESFAQETDEENTAEQFLNPKMKILHSSTGRYTYVSTPVHKTLLVAQGLLGAVSILKYPMKGIDSRVIASAIDIDIKNPEDRESPILSHFINLRLASQALESLRKSTSNSSSYEKSWFASGLPEIQKWLQKGTEPTKTVMKLSLFKLIESLLRDASKEIEKEQASKLDMLISRKASKTDISRLKKELQNWAFQAHTELRDHLDKAFRSRNWHKLSWWKLFWRVDDVSVIASDILNQNFLANAEQEAIFLAGRIKERKISIIQHSTVSNSWIREPVQNELRKRRIWDGPQPPQPIDFIPSHEYASQLALKCQPWSQEISMARLYLLQHTVSALQSLAQRLVFQTITISSLATAFSSLVYISSISIGVYEGGTVAAVGIVVSLRMMQEKWEKARRRWEGDVREEGIRALRIIERKFSNKLKDEPLIQESEEDKRAKAAIQAAEDALVACK